MTFLLLLFLTPGAGLVEQFTLPFGIGDGFVMEEGGRFLVGERRSEKEVRLVRYEMRDGMARRVFEFPQKFEGPLELFAVKGGLIVGDYGSGVLGAWTPVGQELWRVRVKYPNVIRLSLDEHPWMFFNSLLVYRKAPDSSEVEPVLDMHGAEILLVAPVDIAPIREMAFYLLDGEGDIYEYPKGEAPRVIAKGTGVQRILAHPSGGVLGYRERDGEVVWFMQDGSRRMVYRVPLEWTRAIRYLAWTPGGWLVLAGSLSERPGLGRRGIVVKINVGRP